MTTSGGAAAGWYPDPSGAGELRYWDGTRWTENRAPAASAAPPAAAPAVAPAGGGAWFDDPMGRNAKRYWDGKAWTDNVADAAGVVSADPVIKADAPAASVPVAAEPSAAQPPVEEAPAIDETDALMNAMELAMADYTKLVEGAGPEMTEAEFAKRALKIGLIVRETDAWILDLPSGRWFRYDGIGLQPAGGWAPTATPESATPPAGEAPTP